MSQKDKVSAVRLSSMNVELHFACVAQQEDLSLQQKACSDNDMPTHLKPLFEGAT